MTLWHFVDLNAIPIDLLVFAYELFNLVLYLIQIPQTRTVIIALCVAHILDKKKRNRYLSKRFSLFVYLCCWHYYRENPLCKFLLSFQYSLMIHSMRLILCIHSCLFHNSFAIFFNGPLSCYVFVNSAFFFLNHALVSWYCVFVSSFHSNAFGIVVILYVVPLYCFCCCCSSFVAFFT